MAKDITLKDKNGGIKYPKTVTAIVYENGTGKTLQTIIDEMRQVDTATNTRTQHFKADVNNLDTLKNKTDIGLYNYVGTGWRGSVSVCYDSADNVSQVALSSSTPSYNGNTLTWLSAQPCAMARTYTNGAWSHWEKVGAPVVNDLTTGGTDKALSAEMGKTLKEGLDALGPEIGNKLDKSQANDTFYVTDGGGNVIAKIDKDGIHSVDFKIGESSVSTLIQALTDSVASEVTSRIAAINAEETRAKAEEAKKLDHTIEDNKFEVTDGNGNIVFRIDKDGAHSAMSKEAVACMVLSEGYFPTSAPTRDAQGNVTHADVMFFSCIEGSIDIEYTNGLATSVEISYGEYDYEMTINRDSQGNVETVEIN